VKLSLGIYYGRIYFHFGFQPSDTHEHLPSATEGLICPKWLFSVTLAENPRVGGSIPPLATSQSSC